MALPPILVTGGTGTLGQQVVSRLQQAGQEVRVLSRRSRSGPDGVQFVTGDLATGEGLATGRARGQDHRALREPAERRQAAQHGARVAFDCIALGELDRAHTHALTARVAVDAAVTALTAELGHVEQPPGR